MAVLRLANGSDVTVGISVEEVIAALAGVSTGTAERDFVELPGEDGPIHLRPSAVIAIVEEPRRRTSGFRFGGDPGGPA